MILRSLLAAFVLAASLPAQTAPAQVPTVIECAGQAEMVTTGNLTTITYRKNVRVRGTNISLDCDFLKIEITNTGAPGSTVGKLDKFQSLLATGNVLIVQGDREAACGRAEILPEQDKIELTENPVVVDRGTQTRTEGEKITMFRGQRRVVIDKIRTVAPPLKDLGFDQDQLLKPGDNPASPPEAPKGE
jgi:lipopolysaccharide export system protein LptA